MTYLIIATKLLCTFCRWPHQCKSTKTKLLGACTDARFHREKGERKANILFFFRSRLSLLYSVLGPNSVLRSAYSSKQQNYDAGFFNNNSYRCVLESEHYLKRNLCFCFIAFSIVLCPLIDIVYLSFPVCPPSIEIEPSTSNGCQALGIVALWQAGNSRNGVLLHYLVSHAKSK